MGVAQTDRESLNEVEARFLAASRNRRRLKTIGLVTSILVVLASALGGWEVSRLSLSRTVDRDIEQAKKLSDEARWPEAIKVLEGTQESLGRGILNEPLRIRVSGVLESYKRREDERETRERDQKFINALDEARLAGAAGGKESGLRRYNGKAIIAAYRSAFREYGIDIDGLPATKAADLVGAKTPEVRQAVGEALDDWVWCAGPPYDSRLRTIARQVDPDRWRDAIRNARDNADVPALRQLAHDPDLARQPVATLGRLGNALIQHGISIRR